MAEIGVRIDDLPEEFNPSQGHLFPVILNGVTTHMSVGQVAELVTGLILDGAPEALDTLKELADALGDDPDFAATLATTIAGMNAVIGGHTTTLGQHLTAIQALQNYDATLPAIFTNLQTQINGKQPTDGMLTALAALTSSAGKFLAFTGADAPVLRDILGAVAFAGGVPTGAIVEEGNNANGYYYRFANGIQICTSGRPGFISIETAQQGLRISAIQSFTFPAAFAVEPFVVPLADKFGGGVGIVWGFLANSQPSTTGVSMFLATSDVTGNSARPVYIAIGRWRA